MKILSRSFPLLCVMILAALGTDAAQAEPINSVDLKCVARSQRILGEYGECLSKSNARAIRSNPEDLFSDEAPPLPGDAACIKKFANRMAHFGELYKNRGADEICDCATGPEASFFLAAYQSFVWGRSCEQFATHVVSGALTLPGVLTKQPKAGCPARDPRSLTTPEQLCDECGPLNFDMGFDGDGVLLQIIGPGCGG